MGAGTGVLLLYGKLLGVGDTPAISVTSCHRVGDNWVTEEQSWVWVSIIFLELSLNRVFFVKKLQCLHSRLVLSNLFMVIS